MKNFGIHIVSVLFIALGLTVMMAFVPVTEKASASRAVLFPPIKDSSAFVMASAPEPAMCLFDTVNVFGKYWNNSNLFSYSYPSQAPIPDSMYFVMCDSEIQFCIPRNGGINSPYGPRWGTMHKGLDIHLRRGDAVKAAMPGKVRYAQFNTGGYGNLVVLRHPNGLETYYAHLTEIKVKPNAWVEAGTVIGTGGNTGAEWSGEHLHFEMRYRDKAFDPLLIIDWAKKELKSDTLVIYKKYLHTTESASNTAQKQITAAREGVSNAPKETYSKSVSSDSAPRSSSSNGYHTVKAGDTVFSIARKYGKSSSKLLSINGLSADATLRIGQKIRLD
jgi:murein DD-endopeptidase MepM/ murein hydrolase activator NlpD